MKKIVAFGASSSLNSINKDLATYTASQVPDSASIVVNLIDFEMPIYSTDKEKENGIPDLAYKFKDILKNADGIVISFAEHNGVYTAAFKNIFDWISRIEKVVWYNKPMFLLATSNGDRGAISVLEIAHSRISRGNPYEIPVFSLPNFNKNFHIEKGILDEELDIKFRESFKPRRGRVNCSLNDNGKWRWFGVQFIIRPS